MKRKFIYILPILLTCLLTACLKDSGTTVTTTVPTGNFTGQFLRIRLNPATAKLDTTKANLNLSLSQATGFAVTGDTTTLHAGSYGSYAANESYIQFVDATYSASKPGTKYHLTGIYDYTYNGSQLNIGIAYGDTLSLQYSFKKSN